jgi:hypothetical protein
MSEVATVPMEGRLELTRLRATRANGQPALAAYVQEAPGDARIAGITGFAGSPELFPRFGLPADER